MRRILCIIIFVAVLFYGMPSILAASIIKDVGEGNRLYKDEKYDEALRKYNEAQAESPDSDIVNFNVGTTLYRKEDYQKAVDSLTKSLVTKDSQLESMANYNIGNSRVRQGSAKENTDSSRAINLYKEALNYYKRAIDLDEKDEDAKFNYEFVEKKIKELMEKQQQQQQQQQSEKQDKEKQKQEEEKQKKEQQEDQKEKEKQEQKEKERKQKEQEQKEKEQREQEQKEKEKQEQEQKKEQPQPSSGQTPQGTPQGKEEDFEGEGEAEEMLAELGEMSEEEARMLLESYQQEEEAKDIEAKKKKASYPRALRDW